MLCAGDLLQGFDGWRLGFVSKQPEDRYPRTCSAEANGTHVLAGRQPSWRQADTELITRVLP